MNGREMVDQVADNIRNATIDDKIVRWINNAIIDCGMKFIFEHLQKYGSEDTVSGNPDIPLANDYQWMKSIQIPSQQRKLYPKDEQTLSEISPDYRTLKGQVDHYYISGPNLLGLYLVPDGIYTVTYSYQARPVELANIDLANEETDLPKEFHQYLCKEAEVSAWQYEGDSQQKTDAKAEAIALIKKLGLTRYRRPDAPVIMGQSVQRMGRPAQPKLPGNFPRGS